MQNNIIKVILNDALEIISFLDKELTKKERYFFPLTLKELIVLLTSKEDSAYVVIMNQEIVAYGHMRTFNKKYKIPALGIAVGKRYRGLGIANNLCLYMLDIYKNRGYKQVMLKVNKENLKAQNLYKKLGFITYQEDDERKWMIKKL